MADTGSRCWASGTNSHLAQVDDDWTDSEPAYAGTLGLQQFPDRGGPAARAGGGEHRTAPLSY